MKLTFTAALAPLFLILSTLSASTISECQTDIANLRTEVQQVSITGRNAEKDRAGLIGKLDAASAALDKGKFRDAIQKLSDFKTKINQLIASGNINTDPNKGTTGQQLIADADAAISCIRDVATQSGVTCG